MTTENLICTIAGLSLGIAASMFFAIARNYLDRRRERQLNAMRSGSTVLFR